MEVRPYVTSAIIINFLGSFMFKKGLTEILGTLHNLFITSL